MLLARLATLRPQSAYILPPAAALPHRCSGPGTDRSRAPPAPRAQKAVLVAHAQQRRPMGFWPSFGRRKESSQLQRLLEAAAAFSRKPSSAALHAAVESAIGAHMLLERCLQAIACATNDFGPLCTGTEVPRGGMSCIAGCVRDLIPAKYPAETIPGVCAASVPLEELGLGREAASDAPGAQPRASPAAGVGGLLRSAHPISYQHM